MAWRGPVKPVNNPTPNRLNKTTENSDVLKSENRALNVRRDTDNVKNFSVTLMDVDTTILRYLDDVINPQVIDNGQNIKVPVNYASPERWKAIRKDGYMRDKHGKVQTPAIAFRRTTMQRNDNLITFNRYLSYPTSKGYSEKNKYDKFSVMTGFSPVKEIYSVTAPDHVIVNYDFVVWTDYIEQLNGVVEAINFATEDYWGDFTRFRFRTQISDYNFETEVAADSDRIVKATFSMMVYAYLLPETFENHRQTTEKAFSPRKVIFNTELTGNVTTDKEAAILGASSVLPASPITADPIMAPSANYAAGNPAKVPYLSITNGATGGINVSQAVTVSVESTVDTLPLSTGNSVSWLVTLNDGTNFYTSQILANWNQNGSTLNFSEYGTTTIGVVTATLNVVSENGNILLKIIPTGGVWSVRTMRTTI